MEGSSDNPTGGSVSPSPRVRPSLGSAPGPASLDALADFGRRACDLWTHTSYLLSVAAAVVVQGLRPRTWRRTVRDEFVRQSYYTAVRAVPFVTLMAVLVGAGMVSQGLYWLDMAGQTGLIGPVLVIVLVREIAPLLVGLVVIGRSGTAVIAELGGMRATGQVATLDSHGIDPLIYLVVPRVAAMALAVFCLTVWLLVVTLAAGFILARVMGVAGSSAEFLDMILLNMGPAEYLIVVLKPTLIGFAIAVICCITGLSAATSITEIPRSLPEGFIRSTLAAFVISAVISLLLR